MDIETGTGNFAASSEMFDTDDSLPTGRVLEWLVSMIAWDLMDPANESHDRRVELILKKHGRSLEPDFSDVAPTELQLEHPALAACYDAAALAVTVSG